MIYLTGTYQRIPEDLRPYFGFMVNVNRPMGKEPLAVQQPWMLDNGAYGDRFDEARWRQRTTLLAAHTSTCIAAIVPDTLCDHADTVRKWQRFLPIVKDLGYAAAFATQDGARPDNVPWDELDVLFIGGRERHRALEAWPLIYEARRRNIWTHVGRINSPNAMMRWKSVDSVDGNHFVFRNDRRTIERIIWIVNKCNETRVHSFLPPWSQPSTAS